MEGAFHDWKRELERNAREAGTERRQQEKKLQDMRLLAEQLRGFLEQYPYEENRRLQEAWREFHEQGQGIAQAIRKAEERQKELAALLCDPIHASDYELLSSASAEADELVDEITSLYEEWGGLAEALGTTLG